MRVTTQFGRVVYDRKPHIFKWKDAERITRSLEENFRIIDLREKGPLSEFQAVLAIYLRCSKLLGLVIVTNEVGELLDFLGSTSIRDRFQALLEGELNLWQRLKDLLTRIF